MTGEDCRIGLVSPSLHTLVGTRRKGSRGGWGWTYMLEALAVDGASEAKIWFAHTLDASVSVWNPGCEWDILYTLMAPFDLAACLCLPASFQLRQRAVGRRDWVHPHATLRPSRTLALSFLINMNKILNYWKGEDEFRSYRLFILGNDSSHTFFLDKHIVITGGSPGELSEELVT